MTCNKILGKLTKFGGKRTKTPGSGEQIYGGGGGGGHNASALLCVYDKSWMKPILTSLTKMIAEQPSQTQYERPMYHMKEK